MADVIVTIVSHHPQCRDPMRLHHPIPKFNARPFPRREKTCTNLILQNISKNSKCFLSGHLENKKSDLGYHRAHRKPRFLLFSFVGRQTQGVLYGSTPRAQNDADNNFRPKDLEDLISAESLDPLGELQREKKLYPNHRFQKGTVPNERLCCSMTETRRETHWIVTTTNLF